MQMGPRRDTEPEQRSPGEATDHNEGVRRNIWTFDRGGRQAKDIKERILKRQTKNQTDQTRKKQALIPDFNLQFF